MPKYKHKNTAVVIDIISTLVDNEWEEIKPVKPVMMSADDPSKVKPKRAKAKA